MSKAAEPPMQKARESESIKALSEVISCRINKAKFRDKEWRVEILLGSCRSIEVTSGISVSVLVLVQPNIGINDLEKGLSS